jgi:serine/threonine protein phosphatase 1
MSKTYVVTDIHGRLDLLSKAINLFSGEHKVIFLGDYVDRGPDSAGVIDTLKRGRYQGLPWVFLRGNHEDMMIDSLKMPHNGYHWLMNGGNTTLNSYDKVNRLASEDLPFLESLGLSYIDKHRIYIHAYADPNQPDRSKFDPQIVLWERYDKTQDIGWFGRHVVHGHTPIKEPFLGVNRTNLDTGAVFASGYLSVGVFDDDTPGGPVEVVKLK